MSPRPKQRDAARRRRSACDAVGKFICCRFARHARGRTPSMNLATTQTLAFRVNGGNNSPHSRLSTQLQRSRHTACRRYHAHLLMLGLPGLLSPGKGLRWYMPMHTRMERTANMKTRSAARMAV
eukprot:6179093-Pleurochrysis_carterae.AAC.5